MAQINTDTNSLPPTKHTTKHTHISKPWYHHLTLDLFVRVLSRSIFHPAIVMIFWLCLAGLHKHRTRLADNTLWYATFLATVELAIWINHRVAYGKPRTVEWEKEVVVVTGGGRGLGRVLVEMLLRRGVKVGVLEVDETARDEGVEELEGAFDLCWVQCDVARSEEVERGVAKIEKELGAPTILILNAATSVNGLSLLPSARSSLTPARASHTLAVNTTSHFNLLHATLPHLVAAARDFTRNGATIVTVSSILAHLQPSHLSDYAASKSASSSLHHSLTNEIQSHPDPLIRTKVKTLLLETGQLDTALFENTSLPWYASFFGPVLDSNDVARQIVHIVGRGESGLLRVPFYTKVVGSGLWQLIPAGVMRGLRWMTGIDQAMIEAVQVVGDTQGSYQ